VLVGTLERKKWSINRKRRRKNKGEEDKNGRIYHIKKVKVSLVTGRGVP
jgi:hypothetical protein